MGKLLFTVGAVVLASIVFGPLVVLNFTLNMLAAIGAVLALFLGG